MGNAGRVLMIPKGEYNAATTYEMLDCVYYNGRSYVCKQTSTGNAPTNTTYWQALTGDASAEIQALTNQLEDEAETRAALGAKNLLPIDLKYLRDNNTTGTWSGNVYTFTNLSATFNSDGTIHVSGTSNSLLTIDLGEFTGLGDVILSGCPSGGSANTYYLQFYNKTDSQWGQSDYGSGKSATLDPSKTYKVYLAIRGSVTISPAITFKPMIRLATDADPTYQPYAKTNVELTQDVAEIEGLLANAIGKEITTSTSWADLENMGTYVMNGVPFTGSWSIVLVLKRNENTGVQIAFRVGNASDVSSSYIAYRMYYTDTWSSWAVVNATNQT